MKAVVLHEYGPAKNLLLEEVEEPKPGPGEVLVHIHAAGVNPIDWKIRSGAMAKMFSIDFPAILGYDMAGTVQEVGENVTGFAPAHRVSPPRPPTRGALSPKPAGWLRSPRAWS